MKQSSKCFNIIVFVIILLFSSSSISSISLERAINFANPSASFLNSLSLTETLQVVLKNPHIYPDIKPLPGMNSLEISDFLVLL